MKKQGKTLECDNILLFFFLYTHSKKPSCLLAQVTPKMSLHIQIPGTQKKGTDTPSGHRK